MVPMPGRRGYLYGPCKAACRLVRADALGTVRNRRKEGRELEGVGVKQSAGFAIPKTLNPSVIVRVSNPPYLSSETMSVHRSIWRRGA